MFSPSRSTTLRLRYRYTATVVLVAVLTWVSGAPGFAVLKTYAVQLDTLSDTLSTSKPGTAADHTIRFSTPTGIPADGSTIVLTFPTNFDLSTINEDDIDIADDGVDLTTADVCGAVQAAASTSAQIITIEICNGGGGAVVADSAITIEIGHNATSSGTGAHRIVNDPSPGSYALSIGGTMADDGETQLVIIDSVRVSGVVEPYLLFTINGVDAGGTVNNDPTALTGTTTATTVPFGVVQPGIDYVLAQGLSVTTNAPNGFMVTVEAQDDLRATNNATINSFTNGTAVAVPGVWANPSAAPGLPDTYGHWGLTTEDTSLSDNDSFGDALYVGNFINTPREVMFATTSADGLAPDIGATTVGYRLRISSLQEAANDYQTTLVYVVTPIF